MWEALPGALRVPEGNPAQSSVTWRLASAEIKVNSGCVAGGRKDVQARQVRGGPWGASPPLPRGCRSLDHGRQQCDRDGKWRSNRAELQGEGSQEEEKEEEA